MKEPLISYRHLTVKRGVEQYEMLRIAGVRRAEDRLDHTIHSVGAGFSNVDRETRESMEQSRALSDALAQAEETNAAIRALDRPDAKTIPIIGQRL